MRRIKTAGGTLVGKVDMVVRKVVWHIECEECQTLIPLDEDAFNGRRAAVCPCGWKTQPIGHRDRSEDGSVYIFYNYAELGFGDPRIGIGVEPDGIHMGMRL